MKTHLSLNVGNVERSVEFYSRVFGVEPQKQTDSYAKFDLNHPPLNFAMQTARTGPLSRVSHLGVEVESAEEVKAWGERLEKAGIATHAEDNVSCCYARQDKVWFKDPDGNAWEVFVVHEQLPLQGEIAPQKSGACSPGAGCC